MRYPLRTLIPLLLLVFTVIITFYMQERLVTRKAHHIEHHAIDDIARLADLSHQTIEPLLQTGQLAAARKIIMTLGDINTIKQLIITNEAGIIIASLHPQYIGSSIEAVFKADRTSEWPEFTQHWSRTRQQQTGDAYFSADRNRVFGIYPLLLAGSTGIGSDGMIFIKMDLSEKKAEGYREVYQQVIESGIFFATLALVLWILSHTLVSNRLLKILNTTSQISRGNIQARSALKGGDELATISKAFDEMTDTLETTLKQLKDSEEKTRLLLDSTAEGILGIDLNGNCTMANPACLNFLGYEHEKELIGKNMHALIHHTRPDGRPYAPADCPIGQTLTRHKEIHIDDEDFWRKDGSHFPVEYWSHPVEKNGHVIGAVITFLDISKKQEVAAKLRKYQLHLEELVNDRTVALTSVNEELRSFSYSVSHDLRAPLRSIRGFSDALSEEYADKLDKTGRDYLKRIHSAAERMGELIGDLLTLSRVTRSEMNITSVDLSSLAEEIMQHLIHGEEQRTAQINIGENLRTNGDERLLRIALENLLSNAWKFTGKKSCAEITFDKIEGDEFDTYYVRDNGAGFDMKYSKQLFTPFHRLHTQDEFEGTGIGLATVQRIIQRHGGNIWAEGQNNLGATIYFSLRPTFPGNNVVKLSRVSR